MYLFLSIKIKLNNHVNHENQIDLSINRFTIIGCFFYIKDNVFFRDKIEFQIQQNFIKVMKNLNNIYCVWIKLL